MLAATFASAVLTSGWHYVINSGDGLPMAMADQMATKALHILRDVGFPLAAAAERATIQMTCFVLESVWRFVTIATSKDALRLYRELFAVLMFAFAVYESLRLAKIALRGFKLSQHARKATLASALRLAFLLAVYAGPVGKHGLELLPPSAMSDSA